MCEELAFRGFILSGFRHRFRTWPAIFLSSFLFAVYPMNVTLFAPHFLFGLAAAYFVVRCGSVLPAMLLHLAYNVLKAGPMLFPACGVPDSALLRALFAAGGAALVGVLGGIAFFTRKEGAVAPSTVPLDETKPDPLVLATQTPP